jgi:hypothetical protein
MPRVASYVWKISAENRPSCFENVRMREARECLKEVCGQIFEEQLDDWYRVPSSWPGRRDLDAFDRWYEWRFHSVVAGLCADPLFQEEI